MSILDSELADTLTDALSAFDIPQSCVVTRTTLSGPPFDPTTTTTDYDCVGWRDTYSAMEHANNTVLMSDVKIYVVASSLSITPATPDKITINGRSYNIINVSADPAGACWVIQARA